MNHDSDKEMDLLLRRHVRRGASGFAGATSAVTQPDAAHMDADELSAYAEGALPDAARSRYALHLADCDSCRGIVTELVVSSGIERAEGGTVAQTVETPRRSWREWFLALLSPPVLRYAAPALALVAFASIAFVVINRNREIPALVTQEGRNAQPAANRELKDGEGSAAPATANTATADDKQSAAANSNVSGITAPQPDAESTATSGPGETALNRETGAAGVGSGAGSSAPAPKTVDVTADAPPTPSTVQESAAEAKQIPPAQSTSPVDKGSERGKEKEASALADQKKQESGGMAMDGANVSVEAGRRTTRGTQPARPGALGAATTGGGQDRQQRNEAPSNRPATAARARRDTSGADEADSGTATRTVAGKRFRQQNGVWVDTAYNSSRSASRVKRGSERFRALVADEPIIGTVANSLGGDVIVVSGGRAYHIY